jgi:hypothetical protein
MCPSTDEGFQAQLLVYELLMLDPPIGLYLMLLFCFKT